MVFQMGQNKRISEMFKKPVLQFIALLKKKKQQKTPQQTKNKPKSFNCFKKYKIAKTSETDAPQRNLSCKHLRAQLILST